VITMSWRKKSSQDFVTLMIEREVSTQRLTPMLTTSLQTVIEGGKLNAAILTVNVEHSAPCDLRYSVAIFLKRNLI
jgi:hypothetical protein